VGNAFRPAEPIEPFPGQFIEYDDAMHDVSVNLRTPEWIPMRETGRISALTCHETVRETSQTARCFEAFSVFIRYPFKREGKKRKIPCARGSYQPYFSW